MSAVRYMRLRLRMLYNFLRTGSVPTWMVIAGTAAGVGTTYKFADAASQALRDVQASGPDNFTRALGLAFVGLQGFLVLVVAGAVSMRLFETRRLAAEDPLDTLPISRVSRIVIDLVETGLAPLGLVLLLLWPTSFAFAAKINAGPMVGVLLALHFTLLATQVVFAVLAVLTGALLLAPAGLLRRRAILFVVFIVLFAPALSLIRGLGSALHGAQLPGWLPQTWSAAAIHSVLQGNFAGWAIPTALQCALLFAVAVVAWFAYGRAFYSKREEMLAKLTQRQDARAARQPLLARVLPRDIAALLTKELRAFDRDPNLRVMGTGLGAFVLVFLGLSLFVRIDLALLPVGGAVLLACYLVASLGLSSFSQEGRGLPILSTLPIRPGRLLIAKALANAVSLAAVAGLGGAAIGLTLPGGRLPGAILFGLIGIAGAVPLALLVTLLAAVFSRHASFGRRIISPWAMGFMMMLSSAALLATAALAVIGAYLGTAYAVSGIAVVGLVSAGLALALVRAARIEIQRALRGWVD